MPIKPETKGRFFSREQRKAIIHAYNPPLARSGIMSGEMSPPSVLIDCGHIRNAYSGLGQVACQYAAALLPHPAAGRELSPFFVTHPRFTEFQHLAACIGALMRLGNKEWTRYVWRGATHAVQWAARFSWQNAAEQYAALYQKLAV